MSNPENLAIWTAVGKTDPAYTKGFSRSGGFKGTATNATWLAKRATETFGPMGIGWGLTVLDERILDGADGEKVHRVHIRLWYLWNEKRGEIEHFGQTTFCGKRNNGNWFTDEEAPKKSLTDAMSKALSLLGFASDVHLGLFDDNKYVNDLKREFAQQERGQNQSNPQQQGKPASQGESPVDSLITTIRAAMNETALSAITNAPGNVRLFKGATAEEQERILTAVDETRAGFQRRAG